MIMNVLCNKEKILIGPSWLLVVWWDLRHKMAAVGGFVCTLPALDVIALNR